MLHMLSLVLLSVSTNNTVHANTLSFQVTGVKSEEGNVIAFLWSSNEAFPLCGKGEKAIMSVPATDGATLKFSDITKGTYAVTAFHDLDADGETKRGFGGPTAEPVGLSNHPEHRMSGPRFENAQVLVNGEKQVEIQLR